MLERTGEEFRDPVPDGVALSARRKDIISGKLEVGIISADSLPLFQRAGGAARFRVAKVAGPGEKVLVKTEGTGEVHDAEPAAVGERFVAISIERIHDPSADHFIFWRIVGVLEAEEYKRKNLTKDEN